MKTLLYFVAMAGASEGSGSGGTFGMLLPILLMFAIMYFLLFRPQAKKQKETRKMLEALQEGDQVLTIGGVYGTVAGIKQKENIVYLKVADNVKIRISRSAVARKLTADEAVN